MRNAPRRFILAPSLWPRHGYDLGNRSKTPTFGPTHGQIRDRIPLAFPIPGTSDRAARSGGIAVLADGSLRVAYAGFVTAFTSQGTLLWSRALRDLAPQDDGDEDISAVESRGDRLEVAAPDYHSPPVALATDEIVICLPQSYLILDRDGEIRQQRAILSGDDSGYAPNVTETGALILTSMLGDITIVEGMEPHEMGIGFGYDLVPPAVYSDGSLAVAGYSGTGFCRVQINGHFLWRTDFREADLQPTLSQEDVAGVGSLNDSCTKFFSPTGEQIGEYPHAAGLACYGRSDWIAGADGCLARLDLAGHVQWELELPSMLISQAITDEPGQIYTAGARGVSGWDGTGRRVFHVETGEVPVIGLALVAPGLLAFLAGSSLVLVQ